MLALFYALMGLASTVGMTVALRQKNKKMKVRYYLLSSFVLFVSAFLFLNELPNFDFSRFFE